MRLSVIVVGLLASACGDFTGGTAPQGVRMITGRLAPPDPAVFTRAQVALQFAAVALDAREATPLVDLRVGPAFNAAANGGEPVTFRLALSADKSYVLFLQVPVDNGQRIGRLAARVTFPRNGAGELASLVGGRLSDSGPISDLDLGVVNIEAARTSEGMDVSSVRLATLGADGSTNPLSHNDVDADGVPDVDDGDDDDDLIPDDGDSDANGDGVPDDQQILEALPDANGNDVPDLFEVL